MKFTCQAYWANTDVSSSLNLVLIKEIEGISVSHSTNVYSGISVSIMTWSNGYKCTIFVYMSHETSLYLGQKFEGNHGNVVLLFHKAILL